MKMLKSSYLRNFLAEFLGTFVLVVFGDGAIAQIVCGGPSFGNFLNICFAYGLGLTMGILVSGGVSGGHLNPAVSVTMAALRKLDIKQLPVYVLGQFLGAFFAALVIWGIYADGIYFREGEETLDYTASTVGIFASYPSLLKANLGVLAMDQILGTALLLLIILAVTDERNMNVNSSLVPLLIGLGLTAIHLSFGFNAGCAINPARDFAPRLVSLMGGWPNTFTGEGLGGWWWIPTFLPFVGGLIGGAAYHFMIEIHHKDD